MKESLPLHTLAGTLLSTLSPTVGLLDTSALLVANRPLAPFLHRPLLLTRVHLVATAVTLIPPLRVLVMCSHSSLSLLTGFHASLPSNPHASLLPDPITTNPSLTTALANFTPPNSITTNPSLTTALVNFTPSLDPSLDALTHHASRCATLAAVLHLLKQPQKTLLAWEDLRARVVAALPPPAGGFDEAAFTSHSVLSASSSPLTPSLPASRLLRTSEALSVDLFFRAASLVAAVSSATGATPTLLPAFLEDCPIALFLRGRGHYRLQTDAYRLPPPLTPSFSILVHRLLENGTPRLLFWLVLHAQPLPLSAPLPAVALLVCSSRQLRALFDAVDCSPFRSPLQSVCPCALPVASYRQLLASLSRMQFVPSVSLSPDNSSHDNSSHDNSSHDNSSHDNSSHDNSSHDNSSHDNSHDNSSHDNSSCNNSSHDNSSHDNSSHNSSHDNSSHDNSSHATSLTVHILHASIQVIELSQKDTRSKNSLCLQRYTCRCLDDHALVTVSRLELLPNGSPFVVDYAGLFSEPARLCTGACYRMEALRPAEEEFCVVSDTRVTLLPALHPPLPFVTVAELLATIAACTDAATVTARFPAPVHVAGEVVERLLKEKEGRALVLLRDPRTAEMLQLWCDERAFTLPLFRPLLVCDLCVSASVKDGFSVSVLFTASSAFCLLPHLHLPPNPHSVPLHTPSLQEQPSTQSLQEQPSTHSLQESPTPSLQPLITPHFSLPPFASSAYSWLFVDVEAVLLFRVFCICGTCGRVVVFADEHARQCAADTEPLLVPEVTLAGQCGATPVRATLKGDCVWCFLGLKEAARRQVLAFVRKHGLWKEAASLGQAQRVSVMEEAWKEKRRRKEETLIPEAEERRSFVPYPAGKKPRFLWEEPQFRVEESPCAAMQMTRIGPVCLLGKVLRRGGEKAESRVVMSNGDVLLCPTEGVTLKAVDCCFADPQWILQLLLREPLLVCLSPLPSLSNTEPSIKTSKISSITSTHSFITNTQSLTTKAPTLSTASPTTPTTHISFCTVPSMPLNTLRTLLRLFLLVRKTSASGKNGFTTFITSLRVSVPSRSVLFSTACTTSSDECSAASSGR